MTKVLASTFQAQKIFSTIHRCYHFQEDLILVNQTEVTDVKSKGSISSFLKITYLANLTKCACWRPMQILPVRKLLERKFWSIHCVLGIQLYLGQSVEDINDQCHQVICNSFVLPVGIVLLSRGQNCFNLFWIMSLP